MVMDYIRAAYTINMQFDEAGEIIVPVQWYFTADSAHQFPGPHLWGSARTWTEHQLSPLGLCERWDSKPVYSKGAPPFPAPGNGSFCGQLSWYTDGCPSDAPPIQYSDAGVPTCCPQPPCQPFYPDSVTTRSFHTENPSFAWLDDFEDPMFSIWEANGGDQSVTLSNQGVFMCPNGFGGTLLTCFFVGHGDVIGMNLVSYDPDTFTGTYKPPPGNSFGPDFVAFFRCPPS